ncbi:MAG: YfhO family protein [candidate division WOR-3 bacterium]
MDRGGKKKQESQKGKKEAKFTVLTIKPYLVLIIYVLLALVIYGPFLSPDKNLMGTDWHNGGYANWVYMRDFIKENGRLALWNIFIFSGMPTLGAFFPEILTIRFLSTFLLPVHIAHVLGFIILLVVAGMGMYFLLRELYKDDLTAFLGGMLYGFSGVLVSTTYAGHLGRLTSMALLPLYVVLLKRGIDSGKLKWFILMGTVVGISFLNGHPQMTYYGVLFLIAFFIFYNFTTGNKLTSGTFYKFVLFSLLGGMVAALIYSFYLFPVFENLPFTARGAERGYEYAVSWSMPPEEMLNLITPRFSGVLDGYWGRSYFKLHSEYIGIITLVFSLVGVLYKFKRDKFVKFLAVYSIFVLLYVFGGYTPFFRIYYYILPLVKKFRAPNLMFFIFDFINVLIAASLIKEAVRGELDLKRFLRCSFYVLGFFLVVFLTFAIFKGSIVQIFSGILQRAREVSNVRERIYILENSYPTFLGWYFISFVLGALGVFLLYLITKRKEVKVTFLLLSILSFGDLYLVGKNFVVDTEKSVEEMYGPDPVINALKEDSGIFRVFPLMYPRSNDGTLIIHRIQSIGGYTSSPPRRYQKFIGAGESVMFNPQNLITNPNLLNLLDVKYLIAYNFGAFDTTRFDEQTRAAIRTWNSYLSNFELVKPLGQFAIYGNPKNLGRVYFAERYKVFENPEEILDYILKVPFDSLKNVVFLEKEPKVDGKASSDSIKDSIKIEIKEYTAHKIVLNVVLPKPGFLVFSENYHPAWKCYIDGNHTEVYMANYAFRACYCPAGKHNIVMVFDSLYHKLGFFFSLLGFLISFFALGFVLKNE